MPMVASVAVVSDVHGVRPALDLVLRDPALRGADHLVVTGDLASGPQPVEVLDRIMALGGNVTVIRGNADRELVSLARGEPTDVPDDVSPWAAAQLAPHHVEFLAGLPSSVVLDVGGFGPVLFCHATPRSDTEVVLVDSSIARWTSALADVPDEVTAVVCGHTHMPFLRLVDRRLVINSGSVGMPYGRSGAHWASMSDGRTTFQRTGFDLDEVVASVVAESEYPGREEWANYFIRAVAGDVEVLDMFTPADDRRR